MKPKTDSRLTTTQRGTTPIETRFRRAMIAARAKRGVTQAGLANEVGLTHQTAIQKMEHGLRGITLGEAVAISKVLHMDLVGLLREVGH